MNRVVVVPDWEQNMGIDTDWDVTDVVRRLWATHQHLIHDGNTPDGNDDPRFEAVRALLQLPTQEEYEAEWQRQFAKHSEWLDEMRRTNWGMTTEGGL